jgi:ribosomal protein L31E
MAAQSKQTPSKEKSSANDTELPMRKAKRSSITRRHKTIFIVKKSVEEHFREDGGSRFLGKFEPIY